MNFLQLVNRVRLESGASGPQLISVGGTLSFENMRFKANVNEAWMDVQRLNPYWKFMQREFAKPTIAGQQAYTPTDVAPVGWGITDFKNWKRDTFRLYTTSVGTSDEQILGFLDYETFRNLYVFGNMRTTQQRPAVFTVAPNKSILFGAVPNAVFTCVGEYFAKPTEMVADTDLPGLLPDDFHMLIVWRAMLNYGEFEAAPEVLRRAQRNILNLQSRLEIDQGQELVFGPPLA